MTEHKAKSRELARAADTFSTKVERLSSQLTELTESPERERILSRALRLLLLTPAIELDPNSPRLERVLVALLDQAEAGNVKAIALVFDRLEGRVIDTSKLSDVDTRPIIQIQNNLASHVSHDASTKASATSLVETRPTGEPSPCIDEAPGTAEPRRPHTPAEFQNSSSDSQRQIDLLV